jgi:hypothetical protein
MLQIWQFTGLFDKVKLSWKVNKAFELQRGKELSVLNRSLDRLWGPSGLPYIEIPRLISGDKVVGA